MRYKRISKNWILAAFIIAIILLLFLVITIFAYNSERSLVQKVAQWMVLAVAISNVIVLYLEYKKELKKETELQTNESDLQ